MPPLTQDQLLIRETLFRSGAICVLSFIAAVGFCYGCTEHEMHNWGHAQDSLTHILALGTYLSAFAFVLAIGFVIHSLIRLARSH